MSTQLLITATRRPWVNKAIPAIGKSLAFLSHFLPDWAVQYLFGAATHLLVKHGVDIKVEAR